MPAPAAEARVDHVLVLALQRRVGDLEGVEDAHVDLLVEVRQEAGHADEADLALVAQRQRLAERALRVELLAAQAAVELHEVEVVGLQQAQAVLDAAADVLGRVHVLGPMPRTGHAAALRREHVLGAAVGDELADQLLAAPVVDRGVDEVDALVEHRVQQPAGVFVADLRPVRRAAQLHRPEAERRDLQAGRAEWTARDLAHRTAR